MDNRSEIFPVVDEDGNVTGCATRGDCHSGSKLLHPVVHLHVFDRRGWLFLQKRPEWKDIQPGKWDTAVGGHVDYGETTENALEREAREELGLSVMDPEFLCRYVFESDRERELVSAYMFISDQMPMPSDELECGRFWSRDEILASIGKSVFTPNFEKEYLMLFGDRLMQDIGQP